MDIHHFYNSSLSFLAEGMKFEMERMAFFKSEHYLCNFFYLRQRGWKAQTQQGVVISYNTDSYKDSFHLN